MNIETLDFDELINTQQDNPQQIEVKENELIYDNLEKLTDEVPEKKPQEKITLYPLGTVIMLKGGKKRLMIVGFNPLNEEKTDKAYDYIGCLFPEGLLVSDRLAMFNHNQIEKVYQEGLSDEEEKEFKERLEEVFNGLK